MDSRYVTCFSCMWNPDLTIYFYLYLWRSHGISASRRGPIWGQERDHWETRDKERQEGQIWKKYNGRHEIKLHNKALCFANHICLAWGGGGIAMGAIVVEHVHCRQDDMLTHSQKTGSVECSCLSHLSTYHFYL